MSDLIVKAAVKDALSDHNVSADFYDALNEEAAELLDDAAERAETNDRKTVQPATCSPGYHSRPHHSNVAF